jgi:hypothetical protein
MERNLLGTYDLFADALLLFERGVHHRVTEPVRCNGLDDPKLPRFFPKTTLAKLRQEVEMATIEGSVGPRPPPVPEASTMTILGSGLGTLFFIVRRRWRTG